VGCRGGARMRRAAPGGTCWNFVPRVKRYWVSLNCKSGGWSDTRSPRGSLIGFAPVVAFRLSSALFSTWTEAKADDRMYCRRL
jgi:hypothetical protein